MWRRLPVALLLVHGCAGDDTGMKWLAGKTNCLTIKLGEGFCRD